MPTLEQLLADTQLTDDIKIAVNGTDFTVKELRQYAAASRAATTAAEDRRKAAEAEIDKAKKLSNDALALWNEAEKLKAGATEHREPLKEGEIDWENDPVYGPVGRRLSKLEKERLASMDAQFEKINKALGAGLKFVVDDYNERRWDRIPKDQRPEGKTWRDYMKVAEDSKILDANGLFDPVEAYMRSTAEDRRATEIKAAEKRGEERGEKKVREASALPRPGSTTQDPLGRKKGDPVYKTLSEALNAAASDPEIIRVATGEPA